tara:strand:+ start:11247 stop:11522 length:276 start_codon:yes stop_codon:yes gene_type:complete
MSSQRYPPEFKDEAVRQVLERGYTVAKVSQRLGVSAHSLYKWVKAVTPDKFDEQAAELGEDYLLFGVTGSLHGMIFCSRLYHAGFSSFKWT